MVHNTTNINKINKKINKNMTKCQTMSGTQHNYD